MVNQEAFSRVLDELKAALGGEDHARQWLDRKNKALGDQRPIELLESEESLSLVLDEINTIRFGNWT